MLGELAAFATHLVDRHRVLVLGGLALFLLDLPLDRQAVAVPAGDVVGVLAEHLLRAVDDVLQDLVERGADVQMAVGVGRPVVQDELLTARGGRPQRPPQVLRLPALGATPARVLAGWRASERMSSSR